MSIDISPVRSPVPECVDHLISFVGGTAAVTKVAGTGVGAKVTYISTGVVDLTWTDAPGNFLGLLATFQATTAAALKGYTVVPGVYNAATKTIRLNIFNSAFAAADLAALQWLTCRVIFKRTSV